MIQINSKRLRYPVRDSVVTIAVVCVAFSYHSLLFELKTTSLGCFKPEEFAFDLFSHHGFCTLAYWSSASLKAVSAVRCNKYSRHCFVCQVLLILFWVLFNSLGTKKPQLNVTEAANLLFGCRVCLAIFSRPDALSLCYDCRALMSPRIVRG